MPQEDAEKLAEELKERLTQAGFRVSRTDLRLDVEVPTFEFPHGWPRVKRGVNYDFLLGVDPELKAVAYGPHYVWTKKVMRNLKPHLEEYAEKFGYRLVKI